MKGWKIGGIWGFVIGLFLGSWASFNYAWDSFASPIWLKALALSPIMDVSGNILVSIGLTDQNILAWIISFVIFYGTYFGIGAIIGHMIEKASSPKSQEPSPQSQPAQP